VRGFPPVVACVPAGVGTAEPTPPLFGGNCPRKAALGTPGSTLRYLRRTVLTYLLLSASIRGKPML
jgi:hypothetical protein